ncbi:MAG: hypothetical protein KA035_00080 [Candidatus Levybacteria bacterium]|nr:hypothetical protein [Candidatus Levybacteria bacterium]
MNRIIGAIIITASLILLPTTSHAQMQGSRYILETEIGPRDAVLPETQKPEAQIENPNVIKGNGWSAILSSGTDTKNPFLFSVSDDLVNFGEINPGEPLIRTQIISVNPGSANNLQVVASQNHPLRSSEKHEIPNTSCDNGNCTNILSDYWNSPLTYGFGYMCENIEGQSCNTTMDTDTYKRFSSIEANEAPSLIVHSKTDKKSVSMIQYKLNIPGNQVNSGYTTTINLLASPAL